MAFSKITVETTVHAPVSKVWSCWTEPEHITQWNAASDDWHTPRATNDVRVGGKFTSRMEAKDGSAGFDFEGVYSEVIPNERLAYALADGRTVVVDFVPQPDHVKIVETFDAENENPLEMQKAGWQAILDRFKAYVEKP